jgi:hypothetical protein
MQIQKNQKSLLVAAAGISLMALAAGCGPEEDTASDRAALQERHKKMSQRLDRVLDRINATQVQRRRIHQIKANLINQAAPLRKERRQLARKALTEWNSPSPDRRGLHQAVDRQLELIKAFAHLAVDRAIDVHATLTPGQRTQVVDMVNQLRRMHRMWHGHY